MHLTEMPICLISIFLVSEDRKRVIEAFFTLIHPSLRKRRELVSTMYKFYNPL